MTGSQHPGHSKFRTKGRLRCWLPLAAACTLGFIPLSIVGGEEGSSTLSTPAAVAPVGDPSSLLGKPNSTSSGLIQEYLKTQLNLHQIPGASLAVVREGKVVFERCFGYADLERRTPVTPSNRFRIASLSKPLTATGILRLVDAGKLRLDDPMLTVLKGAEYLPEHRAVGDERFKDITIRNLLRHRAGWDRAVSGDPMFQSALVASTFGKKPPASQADTIRFMLQRPLDFSPGDEYRYSNFGYLLLGRVIEHVSGKDYESYMQEEVLTAIGIEGMRLGRTLSENSAPDEVKYYDPGMGLSVFDPDTQRKVSEPYGAWNLEAMDSHGGWIATAADLAKYAWAYYADSEDSLLSSESLAATVERPPGEAGSDDNRTPTQAYYGLGWKMLSDGRGEWTHLTHLGSLPGTSTMLICQRDGTCYALLCNSRKSPYTDHFCESIFNGFIDRMQRTDWSSSSEASSSARP